MKSRNFVESLSKGLSVLSLLAESVSPFTLTELSRRLGLSQGSIQRLTFTLQQLGYIERDTSNKAFRLGPKTLSIGFSAARNLDLERIAYPYLEQASIELKEAVNLAILDGKEIVYVGRHASRQTLNVNIQIGARRPLHCTSMGKVLLAFMPKDQLQRILGTVELTPFTPRTITKVRDLKICLERVRDRGFAISNEEMEVGVRSVAAPIRNSMNAIYAAVNIAVPTSRISLNKLETVLAKKAIGIANKISFVMGNKEETGSEPHRQGQPVS